MSDHDAKVPGLPAGASDEEALRYAIALSLQDETAVTLVSETSQREPEVIDASAVADKSNDYFSGEPASRVTSGSGASSGSFLLDRKAMEAERLERLRAKRSREPSPPESAVNHTNDSDDDVVEVPPPKKRSLGATLGSKGAQHSTTAKIEAKADHPSELPFPNGVVKRTAVRGYPRTPDDIQIEEVLQKDKLQLALLSSFIWDEEWLLSKVDCRRTKLLLAAFAKDEAQKNEMRANVPSSIRFCFPPLNGFGIMHSKLQLLSFPDYLRVVVPSANLVPFDWGETGVMENMVFLIDLPRLSNPSDHAPTHFSTELGRFLQAMGVDDKMCRSLLSYDFAKTVQLGFVASIPGGHLGDAQNRVGYCGLGTAVTALGLATSSPIEVDLVTASLGAIKDGFIEAIYNACQGDNGMKEFDSRKGTAKPAVSATRLKQRVRIYFPTDRTVSSSRGGRMSGGTICFQEKWWRAPTFPKELLRDCANTREGLLMHTKAIFVRKAGPDGTQAGESDHITAQERDNLGGWAYVGSANLSESAWGRLVKDRVSGQAKMTCRNWECGVIVPAANTTGGPSGKGHGLDPTTDVRIESAANPKTSIFQSKIPVPMQMPGRLYGPQDKPWFHMDA